ncbi:ClpP/crotonase, partial [Neoconidiobolus thromboides FSU 785]
ALLISNNGNIFSNGMDVMAIIGGKDSQLTSLERYYQLLSNLLTFPIPTIAVVQGHSFAAGFTFTLCFDYIFMRSEHGYLCMNEVDMPAAIPPGLVELIKQKVRDPVIAKKIILQGHRFTGKEAKQAALVDDIKPKDSLLNYGFEFAKTIAKNNNNSTYSNLRAELYSEVIKQLSHFN